MAQTALFITMQDIGSVFLTDTGMAAVMIAVLVHTTLRVLQDLGVGTGVYDRFGETEAQGIEE